jgi:hypothetical protein
MKAAALSLAQLREHIGALAKPSRPMWNFGSLLNGGLPHGSICGFSGPAGSGKTSFVINLLAQHPDSRTAWIQSNWDMGPIPLIHARIPLQNVVGIESQHEWPWVTLQVVKSQLFSFVVLSLLTSSSLGFAASQAVGMKKIRSPNFIEEKWLRRMQLACEESHSTLFLIHEEPISHSWPLHMQIHMTSPHTIEVLKSRGHT